MGRREMAKMILNQPNQGRPNTLKKQDIKERVEQVVKQKPKQQELEPIQPMDYISLGALLQMIHILEASGEDPVLLKKAKKTYESRGGILR